MKTLELFSTIIAVSARTYIEVKKMRLQGFSYLYSILDTDIYFGRNSVPLPLKSWAIFICISLFLTCGESLKSRTFLYLRVWTRRFW